MDAPWIDWKRVAWFVAATAAFFGFFGLIRVNGHCEHTEWRSVDFAGAKRAGRYDYQVCVDEKAPTSTRSVGEAP